jgi:hypothetical protein
MKELIRQYAGTAIAVVTALVLIALVSEMSVVVEKGIPKSRALCETDKGTGGVDEKHNIRNTGLYGCGLYNRFLSEYLQYFHKKK